MNLKLVVYPAIFTAFFSPILILTADIISNHKISTNKTTEWSIGICEGENPLDIREVHTVKNPVLSASDVKDCKAMFVADPFVIRKDTTWYMFFEVFNGETGQGDIGCAVSSDFFHWKYDKIVLDEKFHISYPFVFEWNNEFYMIPESAEAKELRLYKAKEFPSQWMYVKTLLKGDFGDHALVYKDSTWYLFTGADPYNNKKLRLFYSDSLFGEWKEHPESPLVVNNSEIARPGGRIVNYQGKLYRLAQDCKPTYGAALNAFQITELTKVNYKEVPYSGNPVLKAHGRGWARHGMHQLDIVNIGGNKWIGCVDGYKKNFIVKVDY